VLIGDKDAVAPTETKGLCTAFTDDLLFFAFLSNDKTLRAEEQATEYTYLGYMVFSNFDDAATMSTNYKKIAYIDKNPEGYICSGRCKQVLLGNGQRRNREGYSNLSYFLHYP